MGLLDNALQAIKNQYQETKGNVGLLMSDPKQYMSGLNQDAAEYNRLSSLALQAERNAYRGLPISQEQAAAKQYIDQQQQDMALGFVGNIKPTKGFINEAHQTASINAEKMLGLPPGNTAMDRARAMGFDTRAFTGANIEGEINSMLPKSWFSKESKYSSDYSNVIPEDGISKNPRVYQVLLKTGKVESKPYFGLYEDMEKALAKKRTNTFEVKNVGGGSNDFYVIKDPNQVRSVTAAFDPARAKEADLLAGVVPLGLLAGQEQLDMKKEKKPKK